MTTPLLPAFNEAAAVRPGALQQPRTGPRHSGGQEKFTVVGLGGSAGSVAAFEAFFRQVPPATGMAFVVVMHLVPDQSSGMVQVLQQFTTMPVEQATDGLKVRPNRVYMIPPDHDMSLL
ncbi:chemotaxis protein CheB [Hymenobacter elongatus]|uniref:protein-glutamate methylesterase n=1 Tax=Hymenobacter elongatus TaxID=877208 RepID=A0A4Z0PFF3_9BACT|nr:chemotaxis protein CheB [Hymenobacter elongatus]TGE13847.1 hypothetical protein E5J99_18790 [Hymenobacter elongatus]